MKRGLIFTGALILTGFGTAFLIRFLRDGDVYLAEWGMKVIGVGICMKISGIFK
ncbi:hypothetical protein NQ095_06560 [Rossellomorea sp. SC111]|uniref:hypothetical protein n=1 Tax=Rossellomorea sp. SC111 TaxID=2968985 RepID=UPI00215B064A|nr:hypothetical protein [Rossellomorea sp. SC111]MCR8848063.1 hypothetical protein [Rossellomorea sp. SC111]